MSKDLNRGDWIIDNDPRVPNRRLQIIGFEEPEAGIVKAIARHPRLKRDVRINVARIHADGKHRKSGFSKIDAI